jgi:hypothetical protein
MPFADIAALQGEFARGLLDRVPSVAGLTAGHRFAVHRNNVYAGLVGVLQARYPVIERLVGEEFFGAAAQAFITASPPSSPVLLVYGEGFAAFLAGFEPAACLPYLPDVARLEWLRHAAFHAADCLPLTAADLAPAAGREEELIFEVHPSLGLISSPFPALSI